MDHAAESPRKRDPELRRILQVALTLVVLLCLWRWISVEYRLAEQGIRASFAVEQTGIFEEFAERKLADGIREYYPSGTKQVTGSRLDLLVERCRRLAIHVANCDCPTPVTDREPKE